MGPSSLSTERAGYGSNVLVGLHDAPQTSALFRFGSVVSRQLVFGLPLAAGSRYLKRNVTVAPGWDGFAETVAVKTAPLLASSLPTPPQTAGAFTPT